MPRNPVDDAWELLIDTWDDQPDDRSKLPKKWRAWLERLEARVDDVSAAFDCNEYETADLAAMEARILTHLSGVRSAIIKRLDGPVPFPAPGRITPPPAGSGRRDDSGSAAPAPRDTPPAHDPRPA
jgi:hypothetical protein